MVDQIIEQRRVKDRRGVELLAGNGRADHSENSGADHRADAQRSQRPRSKRFLEPVFRLFRVRDQLVDGLLGEELAAQG
jgi:hypothetical protein